MKTKIIFFCLFLTVNFSFKAQNYVTIPDTNFVTWLQTKYPNCMNGNQMDTTCSDLMNFQGAMISYANINDLTGIKYLNLNSLDCSDNNLTFLPELPPNLQYLSCQGNQISEIPNLNQLLIYLNCASNQITNISNLPITLTELNCTSNDLVSLPVLPPNLEILECIVNQITSLPALPNSLSILNCGGNELISLPDLPSGLYTLFCPNNQITNLPDLPLGLNTISCSNNQLINLPVLPNSLTQLHCQSNHLTSLPVLPNSLTRIDCQSNFLTSLPTLPSSLTTLWCNNNLIDSLPNLPSTLEILDCRFNLLTSLPNLPNTLNKLYCSSNELNSLPILPYTLSQLYCSSNQLNSLPILPNFLQRLDCSNNTLSSLPDLPTNLSLLICNNNFLTGLPVLPNALWDLWCNSNSINNLPILPLTLYTLHCDSNLITSLPILPDNLESLTCSFNQITCFPHFPISILDAHFNISNNPFTCLPNYISAMGPEILFFPLCMDNDNLNNPFNCNSADGLVGSIFLDSNFNCTYETLENPIKNIKLNLYDSTFSLVKQTFSLSNGFYQFTESAGTYLLELDTLNLPFEIQCQITDTTILLNNSLIDSVNFSLKCKPGFDVGVQSVLTNGWVFPGENHELKIQAGDASQWYNMSCASGVSGEVQITVSGPVTFLNPISGALTPSISGNTFTFTISDFGNVDIDSAFGLNFNTNTTAQIGDEICVSISVSPTNADNDTTNNTFEYCYQVVNSFDPNMKEVYPVNVEPGYQDYFTYTVHFQNTGSAPAFNIRLLDTLDSNLDLESFQVTNYSHYNSTMLKNNILTFYFPNIMLTDSTTDFEGSKGFVQYRIKPKATLAVGTQIKNTANIYFDFNLPVVTNTTINQFGVPDPIFDFNGNNVFIFPNPFNSQTTLQFSQALVNADLKMYNVYGQEVRSLQNINGNKMVLDRQNLLSGIYFMKLMSPDFESQTIKFVIRD